MVLLTIFSSVYFPNVNEMLYQLISGGGLLWEFDKLCPVFGTATFLNCSLKVDRGHGNK